MLRIFFFWCMMELLYLNIVSFLWYPILFGEVEAFFSYHYMRLYFMTLITYTIS